MKKGEVLRLAFTRPFCFAVVDSPTGSILFMGNILEP